MIDLVWTFYNYKFSIGLTFLSSLLSSSYKNLDFKSTDSTDYQTWCTKSSYSTMKSAGFQSSIIYQAGDLEPKILFNA